MAIALVFAGRAVALPKVASARPAMKLTDGWDRELDLAKTTIPVIAIYEDKDDGYQNQTLKDELNALDKSMGYRKHDTIKHSAKEYVCGDVHTNTVEGVFRAVSTRLRQP